MSTTVRYFDDGGEMKRIVEHRKYQWNSTGPGRLDRERELVRRWLTVEVHDGNNWVKERELGEYVDPKDIN